MTQALQSVIAALPEIPNEPFMPKPVADRLVELMRQANCYLEYGTGGTTVKAVNLEIPTVFAVESDALWLETIRYKIGQFVSTSECHLIQVEIGPIRKWGYPTSEAHWRSYRRYALDVWGYAKSKTLRRISSSFMAAFALLASWQVSIWQTGLPHSHRRLSNPSPLRRRGAVRCSRADH